MADKAKNTTASTSAGKTKPEQGGFYTPPVPEVVRNYDNMAEYGRLGQKQYAGIFYEEYEPTLIGRRGVEVYREMSESDSVIGSMMFAVEMLLRQASWSIEPGGKTEADKKAAEFVQSCMNDMESNWQDVISEIMSFLIYGWSVHEICYKRRMGKQKDKNLNSKYDDGLIGWRKLPIRAQDTLWRWEYDQNGDLVGMSQMAPPDFAIRTIPMEKALHFITKSRKSSPEGRSILRSCYRDWYFKKRIQEIEGIGVERDLAGLPMITPPENVDIWDDTDPDMQRQLAMATKMVQNVRRDEMEGIVLPFGWNFQLLNGGSRRQFEVGTVIERYDSRISMTILADFVLLGHQNSGSWALSSDKTELFAMAIGTYMKIICDVFNTQAIPRLMDLNEGKFAGMTEYPKMIHGDIEKPDVEQFGNFVSKMVGTGILMPTEELAKEVCKVGGLPEQVAAESVEAMEEQKQQEADMMLQEQNQQQDAQKPAGAKEDDHAKDYIPEPKKDAQGARKPSKTVEERAKLQKNMAKAWNDTI